MLDHLHEGFRYPVDQMPRKVKRELIKQTLKTGRSQRDLSHMRYICQWLVAGQRPTIPKPLFIVGAPRSGTTFLGSCFSTLRDFTYHFEPVATKVAAHYVATGSWEFGKAAAFYREVYGRLIWQRQAFGKRFAEKTPRNCFVIKFLSEAFPDAQFLHITRDGRDVALSLMQKPWFKAASTQEARYEPGGYRYGPFPYFWVEASRAQEYQLTSDFHRCVWAWRRFLESAEAQGKQLPATRFMQVSYEELVSAPRAAAERILSFVGMEHQEDACRFLESTEKANKESVGRWKVRLTDKELETFASESSGVNGQLNGVTA